ncbi:MAG: HAMP domain-containing sensor histidine kinase [Bacteroidales bacterium]
MHFNISPTPRKIIIIILLSCSTISSFITANNYLSPEFTPDNLKLSSKKTLTKKQLGDIKTTTDLISSIKTQVKKSTFTLEWNRVKQHMDSLSYFPSETYFKLYQTKFLYFYHLSDIDNLAYYFKKLKPYHQIENSESIYYNWAMLADCYRSHGDNNMAFKTAKELRASAEKDNYLVGIGYSGYIYATVYSDMRLLKESINKYEEILPIFRNAKNWKSYFHTVICLVSTLVDNHQTDKALTYFNTADSIITTLDPQSIDNMRSKVNLWYFAGTKIYYERKNIDQIEYYELKADSILVNHRELFSNDLLSSKIKYFQLLGNENKTLSYLNLLLGIYKDKNMLASIPDLYKVRANIESNKHNYKAAFQDIVTYYTIKDSIHNQESRIRLDQFASNNELAKIKLEKRELEIKFKDKNFNFVLILLLMFVILSVIILYLLMYTKKINKELVKSNNTKYDFIRHIHHEIRTPLNAIIGFTDLICNKHKSNKDQLLGEAVKNSSTSLLRMVNNMLILAEADPQLKHTTKNKIDVEFQDNNLRLCFNKAIKECYPYLNKNVKLIYSPNNNIIVYSNHTRLTKILTELLMNAFTFTEEGFVKIEQEKRPQYVLVTISDTGPGIPKEIMECVYDYFTQESEFTSGLGIGLTICKVYAREIGAELSFDKTYNPGTKIIFKIPNKNI